MVKNICFLKHAFDTTYEMSNLKKKPPKRDQILNQIWNYLVVSYLRFHVLWPPRWTVRAESLKSGLVNWICLESIWKDTLSPNVDSEMTGCIFGVKMQIKIHKNFCGVNVLWLHLKYSNNLSRILQSPSMTVCQRENIANLATSNL